MGSDLPNVPVPCWLEEEPAQAEFAVNSPSLSTHWATDGVTELGVMGSQNNNWIHLSSRVTAGL